jgi:hypothetical protein
MSDSAVTLSLSATGLQRLEEINHEKDFAFIVGDKRYPCPSFVAEFLSPRVSSLRSQDITIDEFSIETADPGHQFGILLSIGFGRAVSLTREAMGFVRSVCGELWNSELFDKTLNHDEDEISGEELKARLDFLSGVDGSRDWDISAVASHFNEISASDVGHLSPSLLDSILRHPSLVVVDEDFVFDIIHRFASEDLSYFGLLELVRFEFLSAECMTRAIQFVSDSFESLTFGIWSSLGRRLNLSVTPPSQVGRFKTSLEIDSTIISSIPNIFSVFRGKTCQLLYRGSRDGFEGATFHRLCDNHSNNVTLISTTNDCIFGGYTPLAWSGRVGYASDPSLTSFIFTLKNPNNLPARIFKQTTEANAIYDHPSYGPTFGTGGLNLHVSPQCHTSATSQSTLGTTYANDSGLAGNQVRCTLITI